MTMGYGAGSTEAYKNPFQKMSKEQEAEGAHRQNQLNDLNKGAQDAAAGYTAQGQAQDQRQGVQLNYGQTQGDLGQAQGARQAQVNAMDLQASAANGAQPSQAQLLGQSQIDKGLKAQMAGAAGAKGGPLAQMAAQRNAAQGAAATQAGGAQQLAAMRAGEMAQARGEFAGQANALRGADVGTAGLTAGMAQQQGTQDAGQRQLNQQGQQFNQQMGWNTQNAQADRNLNLQQSQDQNQLERWKTQQQRNAETTKTKTGIGMGLVGAAGSALGMLSDVRSKEPVDLMGGHTDPYGSGAVYSGKTGEAPVKKDEPNKYASALGAGMASFGYGGYKSDANAKREAFQEGALYGQARGVDPAMAIQKHMPEYMKGSPPEASRPRPGAQWKDASPEDLRAASDMARAQQAAQQRMTPATPTSQRKSLEVSHAPSAQSIDPDHRGESEFDRSRKSGEVGGGTFERPAAAPMPKLQGNPAGQNGKPGPLSAVQEDANRRFASSTWSYKPEYAPAHESPGEVHHGPMAQELEKNPLTALAVKRDPNSGMRMLDSDKLQQTQGASIASLQGQLDQIKGNGLRYG